MKKAAIDGSKVTRGFDSLILWNIWSNIVMIIYLVSSTRNRESLYSSFHKNHSYFAVVGR